MEPIRAIFQYEPAETRESLCATIRRFERQISLPLKSAPSNEKRRKLPAILGVTLAAILIFLLFQQKQLPGGGTSQSVSGATHYIILAVVVGVCLLGLLYPTAWVFNKIRARSIHATVAGRTHRLAADNAGLSWNDSNSESTHAWDTLTGFVETSNLFNIYKDDPSQDLKTLTFAIPKRAFADVDALCAFQTLLQTKLKDLSS